MNTGHALEECYAELLPLSADWLRRPTRFLFGLFGITYLKSGATVVPNAWIAHGLNLDTQAG